MKKLLIAALAAAALSFPDISQAKLIDQKKADFEAKHGQPVKLETLNLAPTFIDQFRPVMKKVMGDVNMYKTDFWPEDITKEQPILGYIGVWYSLGKVAAVWYPAISKDETIVRALEDALGTSDLESTYGLFTNTNSYRTSDFKYLADAGASWGCSSGISTTWRTPSDTLLRPSPNKWKPKPRSKVWTRASRISTVASVPRNFTN
jgi:hypothetical protein